MPGVEYGEKLYAAATVLSERPDVEDYFEYFRYIQYGEELESGFDLNDLEDFKTMFALFANKDLIEIYSRIEIYSTLQLVAIMHSMVNLLAKATPDFEEEPLVA